MEQQWHSCGNRSRSIFHLLLQKRDDPARVLFIVQLHHYILTDHPEAGIDDQCLES